MERELRNEIAEWTNMRTRPTQALWRDVYGNWRYFRRVQIRAGQFKIPFGMDQLHHPEFINRSLIGNYLAPGRDLGIMAHGKLFDSRLAYQAGIFVHDGWKAHTKDHEYSGERTFAGRVVAPPLRFSARAGIPQNIQVSGTRRRRRPDAHHRRTEQPSRPHLDHHA